MSTPWGELIEQVSDEQTFLRFLRVLREDFEAKPDDWESETIGEFLESAEDWGSRGDFGDGVHYGEPMLRRVAAMLFTGRFKVRK